MATNGTSLRRSCQGCVKVKRRCDLLFPECTRCLKKGVRCQYVNIPLSTQSSSAATENRVTKSTHHARSSADHQVASIANNGNDIIVLRVTGSYSSAKCSNYFSLSIPPSMEMEIRKARTPDIIHMVASIVQQAPVLFAQGHSPFIHPCLYGKILPRPIREMRDLCNLCLADGRLSSAKLYQLLQRHTLSLLQSAQKAANFEELLACVQGLVLAQCIQLTNDNMSDQSLNKLNDIIVHLSRKLWSEVPQELPSTMTPWRAWMFAESVRRTIIYSHIAGAAHSLRTLGYACRTPFVDALPFDSRTWLWEVKSEDQWTRLNSNVNLPMVSLYEYTTFLEFGEAQAYSNFEGVIVATCRGKELPIRDPTTVIEAF
ncbi:hypothetical protein PISL3812_05715 [Talaromyces islandicus]|uniref:Zn(2)-C6 fungal-type domain-containing protein n=1 Tax=Talaromyces islandicus TaxID=28573 RepID=A0A0U1M142_TALIS|nr:hypothetical protein PISL3812_05715 [Talaromyces islandicus]